MDQLPLNWINFLAGYTDFKLLGATLRQLAEERQNHTVYPPEGRVFHALRSTPPEAVKAVIIGQDPYHGPGQACGLSFSVPDGVMPPPSLKNIFKEYQSDLGYPLPASGNLEPWAARGVLLLNAILSVEAERAASHRHLNWEVFTDSVIAALAADARPKVFILWGNYAIGKQKYILNHPQHLILKSAHPSPLSAHNGFFGSRVFSQSSRFLNDPDLWQLPSGR